MKSPKPRSHSFTYGILFLALFALAISGPRARGQLTWGIGGNGGSGTWNSSLSDWWNGSANVQWVNGDQATFAGAGGTVNINFIGMTTSGLVFNSAGYAITGGRVTASTDMTIVANQSATISSGLFSNSGSGTLFLNGTGTLTASAQNTFANLDIEGGEYALSGAATLSSTNVTLANAAGATLTLGQSGTFAPVESLTGGGAAGGVVQPSAVARTTTLHLNGGTFGGVLQDNGSGVLAVTLDGFLPTLTLSGTNTYSGATTVSTGGTLTLNQSGSLANSAVTVASGATLALDNSATALSSRVSSTLPMTLQGGTLQFTGNSGTVATQQAGNLGFSGASSVSNTQPGSATSTLSFTGLTRSNNGAINFTGTGQTQVTGITNDASGIVGRCATVGNEWATVSGSTVNALATYNSNINAAGAADNVKISSGGTTTLASSVATGTLNIQNSSGSTVTLEVGVGQALTLNDGGLLSSGSSANQIQDGTVTSSTGELVVTNNNHLTITASIVDSTPGTILTKSGTGVLTLAGTNTYSGNTILLQGTLAVSSDSNLGTGSSIQMEDGATLKAMGSFSSTKGFTGGGGSINPNGNSISFSGTNAGTITETGTGTLALTNPAVGNVIVQLGNLTLPNVASGNVTMQGGGTLSAIGTLTSLQPLGVATLQLDASGAGTLTTTTLDSITGNLTVKFGLGLSSDLWNIGTYDGISEAPDTFLFDFQNLGGAKAGTAYTLIDDPTASTSFVASMFEIGPGSAGWAGTFNVTSNSVTFTPTAVPSPEPDAILLLGVGGLCFLQGRALRSRRRFEPAHQRVS